MKNTTKLVALSGVLIIAIVAMAGFYVFQDMNRAKMTDEKFGEQVRTYLLTNPSVIREAIEVLTAQERRQQDEAKRLALAASKMELENDGYSVVLGNPKGDVTIVEFFDYRCAYCKRSFPILMKTVEDDGNIRLIMKEFPILGEQSTLAAQAAMASESQGKYEEFHNVLMQARGSFTKQTILNYAKDVGLDPVQLESDMKSDVITKNIRRTYDLARSLGISGTPAFVIGGTLVSGAIPASRMETMVAEARSRNAATATN